MAAVQILYLPLCLCISLSVIASGNKMLEFSHIICICRSVLHMALSCLINSQIKFTTKPFDGKDSYFFKVATLLKKPELLWRQPEIRLWTTTPGFTRLWVCTLNFELGENSCQAIAVKFFIQIIIPRQPRHSPLKASQKKRTELWIDSAD